MDINVEFGENKKVMCHFNGFTVESDQSVANNGDGAHPEPFDYFLCSAALCAGIYVKNYLETRNLSLDGIKIRQESSRDSENPAHIHFSLKIEVPQGLDPRHLKGIERATQLCSVKKAISAGADFSVEVIPSCA